MPSNYCASDACLCCWTDITADAAIVEREESLTDCLFYVDVEECCLAAIGEDSLGFGLITNKDANECGKVSTGCVACGVVTVRHQVSWHLVNLGKAKGYDEPLALRPKNGFSRSFFHAFPQRNSTTLGPLLCINSGYWAIGSIPRVRDCCAMVAAAV